METIYKYHLVFIIAICILGQIEKAEGSNKRCTFLGATTLQYCKASCKILGHTTGVCDQEDRCICSEEDYDFLADVTEWVEEHLDIATLTERMDTKYNEYKDKVRDWARSANLRDLVPSKCKISRSFCNKACKAIGLYNGTCNADFTDCDCAEEWVTPTQYGLCASETICRLDCQANGKASGKCVGAEEWDCQCESRKDTEGKGEGQTEEFLVEYDIQFSWRGDYVFGS